ncbi:MAG: DUF1080 domain-containing protein [Pirellulaceae bacterium]|jgi:hypothetical protein|nr:DUF1080 domain-containing protein [Pirellulaceae bacterium]MDP7015031.1 DUF1080 domain-containing protein [Pirellulaceae bacterium]
MNRPLTIALLLLVPTAALAQPASEFRPLFNGRDLDGWVPVNTAPSTWSVRDEMLICTGKPIGELRTTKMYQNFVMEVEWRHMKPRGNAGIFVWADDITARGVPFHRSVEVQVLENAYGNTRSHTTHGDIFPIHGAKMTPINGRGGSRAFPTENRSKPSPEWNHYRIECRDGDIALAVNGKIVTRGTKCSPSKGYICLESEGGVVHYRNLKIQELPDTPVDPKDVATANRDFRCLYNGIDLEGWRVVGKGWKPSDWVLAFSGDAKSSLTSDAQIGNVGFVFDVRGDKHVATATIRGAKVSIDPTDEKLAKHLRRGRNWNRIEGELRGTQLTLRVNGQTVETEQGAKATPRGRLVLTSTGPVDFANIYIRDLK